MHRPADLAAAGTGAFELGRVRKGSRVLLELAPPLSTADPTAAHRAIVRVVAPDMPFLVESLGIVFSEMNIAVHLIVHPVLNVRRDARGRLQSVGVDERARARRILAAHRDRPAARRSPGARAAAPPERARSRTCARRSRTFRRMLERVRAVANDLERAPPAGAQVACGRGARAARLDARRALRVPGLSLLPPEARPRARRAGARRRQRARHPARPPARPQAPGAHRADRPPAAPGARARPAGAHQGQLHRRRCIAPVISTTSASRPSMPPAMSPANIAFSACGPRAPITRRPRRFRCCAASSTR